MSFINTIFKLLSHIFLALIIYINQVFVSQAFAVEEKDDLRSDRQHQTIENAEVNKAEDASGNQLKLTSCSDTSDIARNVNAQKIKFNDAYFAQYQRAQFEMREEINRRLGLLYGTYSFVGSHGEDFGFTSRPVEEIREDLATADNLINQRIELKAIAQADYEKCLDKPTADPQCTAERLAVESAQRIIDIAKENRDTLKNELATAEGKAKDTTDREGSDIIDKSVVDFDKAVEELAEAKKELDAAQARLDTANDACDDGNGDCSAVAAAQENYLAIQRVYQQKKQEKDKAGSWMVQQAYAAKGENQPVRARQQQSDFAANELEELYKTYNKSIDDFIRESKRVEREAMEQYESSERLKADNSDYDIFQAIMKEFDNDADKIINKTIMIKEMGMTATASSGISHLVCTEIKEIVGIGSTGPLGDVAIEVTSLRLFKAASAMYLVGQINSASTYDDAVGGCILRCDPIVDINSYDRAIPLKEQVISYMGVEQIAECFHKASNGKEYPGYYSQDRNSKEDKDEQIAAVERAANTYQKLVDATILKTATMEDALEMYRKAWEASLEELRDKLTRVSTSEAELSQARAMVSSTEENIAWILVAIAIMTGVAAGCCATTPVSGCCAPAVAMLAALIIYLALLEDDLTQYDSEVAKWETELKRAQTHAQLDCNFPGWNITYNNWNRGRVTDGRMDISELGEVEEVVYTPTKKEDPFDIFNLFKNLPIRITEHIRAPFCSAEDLKLAKKYFAQGKSELLNIFISNAHAEGINTSDTNAGNALGFRGREDIADKTQSAGKVDTTLFEIYLAQKLLALKLQTYNPLDDDLMDLRQNPVKVDQLIPQENPELALYLFRLVDEGKVNKSNAMDFAPVIDIPEDMPTNTGFPQVETRHFYIESVLFQLRDLIVELNNALGRNCGIVTPMSAQADLSENPDQFDGEIITGSSLCDQRDYYVSLLNQMRQKMNTGVTGLDSDDIETPEIKKGTCMKQDSVGQFSIDEECECLANNSCAQFSVPNFAKLNIGSAKSSKIVLMSTNATLSGKTKKAELLNLELSKNSSAVRKRIRILQQDIKAARRTNNKAASIKKGSRTKKATFSGVDFYNKSSNSTSNARRSYLRNKKQNEELKKLTESSTQEVTKPIYEKNNTGSKESGQKKSRSRKGSLSGNGTNVDLNFGIEKLDDNGISLANAKINPLLSIELEEDDMQKKINGSFLNLHLNQQRATDEENSIHKNSELSLFKIISTRYQETAFPVLLNFKVMEK